MQAFALSRGTKIVTAENGSAIAHGVAILYRDMGAVLTETAQENQIRLVPSQALGEEKWHIRVEETTLTIAYGDDLGAVYGLLYISEHMLGIPPLFFWNDVPLPKREKVLVPLGETASPAYAVRYRGWFINDEVLLDPWKKTPQEHREVWRMAFETILRMGGNMVIPGTDRHGDGLDQLASEMGLILTQHHAELLGAEMFGRVWPELRGSYRLYPDKFEQLWREAAQRNRHRKVLYAIGFRGQGDGAFWHEDPDFDTDEKRGKEISRIMRRQMEIVRQVTPDAIFCTNLYGEMMQLYREGWLDIPQGVIKIWADNGYGRMLSRRQGDSDPRVDAMPRHESGENGIYYHASFYDLQAANHITPLQIAPEIVAQELCTVLSAGADCYWIINCGCVKPHGYILDLIRTLWRYGTVDVEAHARAYARTYLGGEAAAPLLLGYAGCAVAFGPEADQRAGDQYYHLAARALACGWMRGEYGGVKDLRWAEQGNLVEQAQGLARRCAASLPKWAAYRARCEELAQEMPGARLLRDTLGMYAAVHYHGCRMLMLLGDALDAYQRGRYDEAFLRTGDAAQEAEAAYQALRGWEHDQWIGYYENDCFTNLKLTARVLTDLRDWIRNCFDGPYFWGWERKHLMEPRETRIVLQTHRRCQLDHETLYHRMKEASALRACGQEGVD